jgi:hypothetical protein
LDRYDRELRRPFPSQPQFAPESEIWRREHAIPDAAKAAALDREQASLAAIGPGRPLEI